MHDRNDEILFSHDLLKLFNSLFRVTVDECLVDVKVGIEVQENLDFPLFFLDCDVVLMDTFKSELLVLDQDLGRISHEMLG